MLLPAKSLLTAKRCLAWSAPLLVFTVLSSCSSGPSGPAKGTPGFYWQAARETFAAGDNVKTLEHLDKLLVEENEYSARALPWSLILTSGTAAGYAELADHYELGGRVNKSDPAAFRRPVSVYRGLANRLSLEFAEKFGKLAKLKGDTIPLAFGYPKGTAAPVPVLTKVASGIVLAPPDAEAAEKRALERGVLLAACRAAGAPGDTARTEQILKSPDATVPRATFEMAMAQDLFNASQLYTPRKLDEPQKLAIFCQRAQEALKGVPESKESKELAAKIQNALKRAKKG